MIWEQNTYSVVMLNRVVEKNQVRVEGKVLDSIASLSHLLKETPYVLSKGNSIYPNGQNISSELECHQLD